ncbi:granulin [Trichonephila inaurata madagascariensis]|uniref:Granulin n=1 Tax=Trichonephila inaurata madagascariensis TaxID=2747483 RepID=A0A8X6XGV9_9ARAC|nr:granulin [Trichonephila inaurata madagascariensis]
MGIKICPDKLHLCPATADCCRRDGTWGCCPKVSNLNKGECCTQFECWTVCCTDLIPKCHWWGCCCKCFHVCGSNEPGVACDTQCRYGCCPYNNGVCCDDGTECCKERQTCISHTHMCLGINDTGTGNFSLYSEKTTPVGRFPCNETETTCLSRWCCPTTNAVCCDDDDSCCPAGFECSPDGCVRNEMDNSIILRKFFTTQDPENTAWGKKLKDMKIMICPDKLHLCPATADCCRRDGTWGCCPKVLNLKGECCTQYGQYRVCCFDLAPKCHWWGCWFS